MTAGHAVPGETKNREPHDRRSCGACGALGPPGVRMTAGHAVPGETKQNREPHDLRPCSACGSLAPPGIRMTAGHQVPERGQTRTGSHMTAGHVVPGFGFVLTIVSSEVTCSMSFA